jgi:cysteine desulfurase
MAAPIYLDHHATTPLDPRVREAMLPYLGDEFGNAGSKSHAYGWRAEAAVERARAQVAALLGCDADEILFTSGATESNNLAIKGVMEANRHRGDQLITTTIEHHAVLDCCKRLERMRQERLDELSVMRLSELAGEAVSGENFATLAAKHPLENDGVLARWREGLRFGARATYVAVGSDGRVDPAAVERAFTEHTVLVSVMLANNEVGTVQPLEALGRLCRERGVLLHSDVAQAAGKLPFDVRAAQIDLASVSAHKLYGPKGVGALYVRKRPRVRLLAQMDGGGQERGLRSGTLNVAGIVGFGVACAVAAEERAHEAQRLTALRDRLWEGLRTRVGGVQVNGSLEHRLPGNLNVSFEGVDPDALSGALRDIAVSSGSACTSASGEPSYVLRALGVPEGLAAASVRFGLGRSNTDEEVDRAIAHVAEVVGRLRKERA